MKELWELTEGLSAARAFQLEEIVSTKMWLRRRLRFRVKTEEAKRGP